MKTWLEDNWFNKIDRLLEREKLRELPPRYLTTSGDEHEKLDVDNLTEFPELMNFLFFDANIGDYYDPADYPDHRLEYLVGGIGYRDDERGECRHRAEIFKNFLIDTFIDNYTSRKLSPVEREWQEAVKTENGEALVDKATFFKRYYGISLEEFNQRIEDIRTAAERRELEKLSKDAQSVGYDTRAIIFDVRLSFVSINTTSNFLQEAYKKSNKGKSFATFLKNRFECSSFRTGITATEGGKADSEKAEDKYTIDESLQRFQKDVYPLIKDHFRDLSEDWYRKLQKAAVDLTYAPAFEDTPAIEALKVARTTAVWFKNQIGCNFEAQDRRFIIRTDKGIRHRLSDTVELWNPLYRADAVYLIDSDKDFYSDGTPAKRYISVQVKSGKSNFVGSGAAYGLILKNLQSYGKKMNITERVNNPALERAEITKDERIVVRGVFLSLCRGGYAITRDSWESWSWLPDDYMNEPLEYDFLDDSNASDYYIRFKYVGHYYKLRVAKPDKEDRLLNIIRLEPDFTSDKKEAL